MKRKQPYLVYLLVSLALLGWNSQAYGNQGERTILTIDEALGGRIEQLEIDIGYGFGTITVERGNPAKAVTGYIEYNADMIRPEVRYEESGNQAHFRLETKTRREGHGFDLDMDDINEPKSELYFTTRVPIDLDFACGLGEGRLDLGELKISDLKVENGLGDSYFDFSTVNGTECRNIDIDNGLGELTVRNLSNSRTREMEFDCGLGSADLDFSGDNRNDMDVEVNVGLGSVTLRIPEDYNVELKAEGSFLSSVDTHGMVQINKGLFRTRNFESSRSTLRITAKVGLGSIDIKWID